MKIRETDNLILIDDVFTDKEKETMDDWFAQYTMWGLGYDMQEYGASSATLCRSLKYNQWVGYHHILDDIQNIMRERIEAETDIKVPLFQRCLINNFKFGDSPMFHKDAPGTPESKTFMVYPNMHWERNWAGYTVFADDNGEVIDVAYPQPGRVVIFSGDLDHCGVAPTKVHKGYGRFSIAYQDPSDNGGVDRQGCSEEDIEKTSLVEHYGDDFFRLL